MQDIILNFIMWIVAKNPMVASLIVMVGTMRLVMKPIMSALQQVVDLTATKVDDEMLKKVLDSKWYKAISWFLDYVGSIKLPQSK